MKPQKLNRTCGFGGMIFRRTDRVASTLWKKLGSGLENRCGGREGGHGRGEGGGEWEGKEESEGGGKKGDDEEGGRRIDERAGWRKRRGKEGRCMDM